MVPMLIWGISRFAPGAARNIVKSTGQVHGSRRPVISTLFVDLTLISANDAGTGIQRVVRETLAALIALIPANWLLTPIRALDASDGFETLNLDSMTSGQRADPRPGDVYLALDYAPRAFVRQRNELLRWATRGVDIHVVIYDLLPLSDPEWFTPAARRNMRRWLRCVAVLADRVHCLSRSVRSEVENRMTQTLGAVKRKVETNTFQTRFDFSHTLVPCHTRGRIGY